MSFPDINALTALVYDRLKSHAAGQAFRDLMGAALLGGDGADSIIPADALEVEALPPSPFTVFRAGSMTPIDRITYLAVFTFWIYDADDQDSYRINAAATALIRAFQPPSPRLWLEYGGTIGGVELVLLGQGQDDQTLEIPTRGVQLGVTLV